MSMAKSNALFLHCLPAQRGLEVTKDVIDGPNSVVFDQTRIDCMLTSLLLIIVFPNFFR